MYMAPEMIKGEYTEKCDVWSCGVIMYLLISGNLPFEGKTSEEILKEVIKGNVRYLCSFFLILAVAWDKVSPEAKALVKKMINPNPLKRITAEQALNDSWIKIYTESTKMDLPNMIDSISNLKSFQAKSGLQKAVVSYMSEHFISLEQEKKARESFEALDKNKDGQLSRAELIEGYKVIYGNEEEAKIEVDKIMLQLDINKNGTIDYKEFLMANFENEDITNTNMLKQAFNFFDAVFAK